MDTIVLTGRPSHRATVAYNTNGPCAASCRCGHRHIGNQPVYEWYLTHTELTPQICPGSNQFVHGNDVGVHLESDIVVCPTCKRFQTVSVIPGEDWWTIDAHRSLP